MADDTLWGLKKRFGSVQSDAGSTHLALPIAQSVSYIESVVDDYRVFGGIDTFHGAAVDVGAGDSAGVGLLLRAAGCQTVDLVDRFRNRRDIARHQAIYRELSRRHGLDWLGQAVDWDDSRFLGITWHLGVPAEEFFAGRASEMAAPYDLIVGRGVIQSLFDPIRALRDMAACLKPGGRMAHKIDLRDLGMFSSGHSELTFLRFPPSVHRRMGRYSGRPNGVRLNTYRQLADELRASGFEVTILVTILMGEEDEIVPHAPYESLPLDAKQRAVARVEAERHRFASEFRGVDSGDLAVAGIFITAVAPA